MTETENETTIKKAVAATKAGLTPYVVFAQDGELWKVAAKIAARSGDAAIRAHVSKAIGTPGVLVAIPARSFQPVKVTPKVETTLLIEDVKA